eukprot:TRINITY_DN5425_c0_g2_i1.p1 TRINITY_DN5425_c0_g2~~TRINITY_DN5425_c0_g2_i1.p1  ORF type:complete len:126 (+),score=25.58 TRINITY_DN5425_c0_g2_i1:97-474(+)
MGRLKTSELKAKKKQDLEKQLTDLKVELSQLRVAQVTGGVPAKLTKIREVRKSIAQVLSQINFNQREHLKLLYKKKSISEKPYDLRPKLTRALRKRLPISKKNLLSLRKQKRKWNFPIRKYAIKA